MSRDAFQKIFESIRVPEGVSNEELNEILKPLSAEIRKVCPSRLYKYRSCQKSHITAFEEDKLWLSTADKFNDPFDTLVKFDREAASKMLDLVRKPEVQAAILQSIADGCALPPSLEKCLGDEKIEEIRAEARSRIDMTFQGQTDGISNVLMLSIAIMVLPNVIRNQSTIVCLSENIESILMWSHYSNNHQGFALGYDMQPMMCHNPLGLGLFPVIYDSKRYDATEYIAYWLGNIMGIKVNNQDILAPFKLLLYKAQEWAYEEEWRLLNLKNNSFTTRSESVELPPSSIYYGCMISKENFEELHKIAIAKGLEEYKMVLDEGADSYSLRIHKL